MTQRNFKYQDDKSSKFWNIILKDCNHAVNYGKVGTTGRTQSKSFDTVSAAKKSCEKLIQQKLNKGYIEVITDNDKVREEKPKDISTENKKAVVAKNKTTSIKQTVEQTVTIPKKLEVTRSIDLNPEDWHWATWRPRTPLPKPEVKPFNLENAKKRLEKVAKPKSRGYQPQYIYIRDWSAAKIDNFISQEEALFWLAAISSDSKKYEKENYQELIKSISAEYLDYSITIEQTIFQVIDRDYQHTIPSNIASIIHALFPFINFISALNQRILSDNNAGRASGLLIHIIEGFKKHIWHYLTDTEVRTMNQQLDSVLNIEATEFTHATYYLAAYLGMHDRVFDFVKDCSVFCFHPYHNTTEYEIIAGLGSANEVESQMRRLNFKPYNNPNYIRLCLATTEYSALDLIRNGILHQYATKDDVTKLLETFALVKAPEAAPYMLELWLSSKAPSIARKWLDDNPLHSIVGLIPVAAGQLPTPPIKVKVTEMSRAAIDYLISLKRKGYEDLIRQAIAGYEDLIRQAIAQQPAAIAEAIAKEVLEIEELNYEPLDEQSTPQWLQQGVKEIKRSHQTYKLFWVTPADLPPLLINQKCFNESQVSAVLIALSKSTLDTPHPILKDLKNNCNRTSVDNFIWSLFQRWLTDGASKKENWAMLALGLLGEDEIAIQFTPYLRKWPGESQHHRAVLGLQCLRAIGSDTALMQINGIARKIKYKGLKARAQECIKAIAKARQLSPDELEDRIIPSLGLDAKGQRVFDYGDRQFHFVLGQDLIPMVRDEKGKIKASLPKPAKKDNEELANLALADWKLLKKQIRETLKIQTIRLEQAMIAQRRWQWQEFEDLLANHPLMTHLVQRIIWAGYDRQNNLVQTFRLAEDRTYADAEDEEIDPQAIATVGIVHSIHLTLEQRSAWGETLSDYEIIPPFPQIDREIYSVTPEEAEIEITRFKEITIPGITLLRTMESLGWLKGGLHDHGDFGVNYKYFPQADITAIIGDYEYQHVAQDSIYGDDAIDGCLFFPGKSQQPDEYPIPGSWYDKNHFKGSHLKLKDVDTLVMSEVLRDLYIVTSKAK